MWRSILVPLVMGMLGVTNAQLGIVLRPKHPAHADKGCKPGAQLTVTCPPRMECFVDKSLPLGGRCDCNPLWFKYSAKLPYDDLEWDDGMTTSDCQGEPFSVAFVGLAYLITILISGAAVYTAVVVVRELIRVKAFKFNATATSLFVVVWGSLGNLLISMIYMLNTWGLDQTEYWYTARTILITFAILPPLEMIDYEVGVSWLDLYDRTNKMSKKSSKGLKLLRYGVRFIGISMTVAYIICIKNVKSAYNFHIWHIGTQVLNTIFNLIAGYLILRVICPDRKDVSNPNWKVAEAIRRAVKHSFQMRTLYWIGNFSMLFTYKHRHIGYFYGHACWLTFFSIGCQHWGWLHYLIYGSRKHLKRFATENASAYFGFSTIGLNKTITRASSVVSSRSSAVSGRSSVADDA